MSRAADTTDERPGEPERTCTMKRPLLRLAGAVAAIALAIGQATPGWTATILGDAIPLSQLVDDGRVVVGDKEFTEFSYSSTNDMPSADGVNVIPIQDDFGNFGIRLQGAFLDSAGSQGGSDALLTYRVTALDPLYLITDAHLVGNPNKLGETGSISVTETFLPLGALGEFTMEIFDDDSHPQPRLADEVIFDEGRRSLGVQKDILAFAQQGGALVTMSFVDQTFSQTLIPEPASAAVGMLGVVGAAIGTRRRRK